MESNQSFDYSDSSEEGIFKKFRKEDERLRAQKKELESLRVQNIEYKKIEISFKDKITNTKSVFQNLLVAKELSPMK